MILTVVLLLISAPLVWWYLVLRKYKCLDGIPGPRPLPFIGNAFDLGNTPQALLKNMCKQYEKYGDIFKIYVGPQLKVFVANADFLEKIMTSTIHISKSNSYDALKPWINLGLLTSTGEKWKARRKMISPCFHFTILERFLEIFNSSGDILTQKLAQKVGENFDVASFIHLFSLDIICETSMGVKVASQQGKNLDYTGAIQTYLDIFIVRFFSPWEASDTLFKFSPKYKLHKNSLKILQRFSDNVIAKRRAEKVKDKQVTASSEFGIRKKVALLDMLLESEEVYNLSNDDIKEEINTFLAEGYETTSCGICFTLLVVAEHQDIQEKLYDEILAVVGNEEYVTMNHLQDTKYLDMVLKEVLRMYPVIPVVERRLETNFNIGGIEIPKGVTLDLYLYGVLHNEKYYPKPDVFDPNRFLPENQAKRHSYAYVPFSAGPRNCVGQKFAMLEMKATIIKILQKFQVFPVPNYKPELGVGGILKSYNGILIRLEQRRK